MSALLLSFTPPRIPRSICRPTHPRSRAHLQFLSSDPTEAIRRTLSSPTASQITVGSVLGFSTGYAIKRIGQMLLVFVGCEIVALQLMAQRNWVIVNWNLIGRDLSPAVEKGGVERVLDAVRLKVPFAGSFTAGCYAGFRWS